MIKRKSAEGHHSHLHGCGSFHRPRALREARVPRPDPDSRTSFARGLRQERRLGPGPAWSTPWRRRVDASVRRSSGLLQRLGLGLGLPHRCPFQFDTVRIVEEAIADGVGLVRVANDAVPVGGPGAGWRSRWRNVRSVPRRLRSGSGVQRRAAGARSQSSMASRSVLARRARTRV